MIGRVGADSYGDRIVEKLRLSGVDARYIYRDPKVGTGIANIYVDPDGDNSIVIVPQSNARLSATDVEQAAETILDARVLLLQMEIPDEAILAAARLGQHSGATVILNPAPAPPSGKLPPELLPCIDIIIPNQSEIELLTGLPASDSPAASRAARQLQEAGVAQVVVTMGEQGALLVRSDGSELFIPAFKVDAVDTTAAGDAFCGVLASTLACGATIEQAVRAGCAAGALATTICGAEPSLPDISAIEGLLHQTAS
jgi:ribokinase